MLPEILRQSPQNNITAQDIVTVRALTKRFGAETGAHVFESMRGVMVDHIFRPGLLVNAAALNAVYLALSGLVFLWAFANARKRGALLQLGE